jgi:1-acyl-sn-glycerol-3-phosphate acyltransferase
MVADYMAWARFVLRRFDVSLRVEGAGNAPAEDGRRLVVVSNHQSQLDIPALVAALDRRIGFVAKKELASIPLLNYWMRRIGCVFIDRSDKVRAHRALEEAAKGMGAHPLVVFPEGTRSQTGQLLPLKLGGFRLALSARARVLPVLIEGTRDAAENRAGTAGPVPVRVRVFPPLDTAEIEDGKPGLNRIKDYVEACWRSAAPPGGAPGEPGGAPGAPVEAQGP